MEVESGKLKVESDKLEASPALPPAAKPIQWAHALVAALKKSGTGEDTLNVIRGAMLARANDPLNAKLPAKHPDRHLTAKEALGIVMIELPGHTTTIEKINQFITTGHYIEPTPPTPLVDLLELPPEEDAPERAAPEAAAEPMNVAGVRDKIPGIHKVTQDIDTVGPKPMPVRKTTKLKVGA
jgi:hypothetical protein